MRRLSPAAPLRLPLSAPLSAVSTVRGAASPMPPSPPPPPLRPPLSNRRSAPCGSIHATAGQLLARQLPIVEVVEITTSCTKCSKPPPRPCSPLVSQSPLSNPATDQLLPPPGNLRPQNRSDAADSGHAAAPSILLVAHQKTGGRAQDVFLLLTPHLWTKKCWWRAVAPGAVTIARR